MKWIDPKNDDHPPPNKVVEGRWDNPEVDGTLTHQCIYTDRQLGWYLVTPRERLPIKAPDAWRYKPFNEHV